MQIADYLTHTRVHTLQYTGSSAERLADGFRRPGVSLEQMQFKCYLRHLIWDVFFLNIHNPWHLSANENQVGWGPTVWSLALRRWEWRHSPEWNPPFSLPAKSSQMLQSLANVRGEFKRLIAVRVVSGRNAENCFFSDHLAVCSGEAEGCRKGVKFAKRERCQELSVCIYEKTYRRIGILHKADRWGEALTACIGLVEAKWGDKMLCSPCPVNVDDWQKLNGEKLCSRKKQPIWIFFFI